MPEETTYFVSAELLRAWGASDDLELPITGHALADAPPDVENGPYPLVVFSPGLTMWRQSLSYLMEHIASYGFVVISMEHRGEYSDRFWEGAYYRPAETLLTTQYADQLTADGGDLGGVIDLDKLAVMGHSSGGWTALIGGGAQMDLSGCPEDLSQTGGLVWYSDCISFVPEQSAIASMFGYEAAPSGLWPQQFDPRVDAVISMSPDGDIWGAEYQGVASLNVPTMVVTSPNDSINVPEHGAYPIYEQLGTQVKSLLQFQGADHPLPSDTCADAPWVVDQFDLYWLCSDPVWDKERAHDLFNHFTTAFLLDTLKGDAAAHEALAPDAVQFPGIEYQAEGF